ncbi:hypothetical protein DFH09DRAFT_1467796 [Mycena vulgaris]|nr:hypothetical protein DFH09DRAFT_1467796 [Mycena vulgaris]
MSTASPTFSNAGKENDTAEQLQNLKRRGDNYQREVYNGRKKLKRSHAATTDQSSSISLRKVGWKMSNFGQSYRERGGSHCAKNREGGGVASHLQLVDAVGTSKDVTLSSDGTTHKNINLESRRAAVINQNTEKQHFFSGIGMAVNHTSEKQLEGWQNLIEAAYKVLRKAAVAAAGGSSALERVGEEHRVRHNATLTEFVREISREEFDEWSDQEKQDVDLFIWGVVAYTTHECVQGCGFIDLNNDGWTPTTCPGLSSCTTETVRLPFLLPRERVHLRERKMALYKANIKPLVLLAG